MRVLFLIGFVATSAWAGETDLGAQLPDGARKVAEHRYRAPADFDGTMKFYKSAYSPSQFPRKPIVNQPGVKAVHLVNTSDKGDWEGLNIYKANDEVRIYVVPREGSGKRPKK